MMPGKKRKNQKVSTNKIYAGVHWGTRQKIKNDVLGYAVEFCRPIQKVKSYPIAIRYRFLFRKRPLDTLNTAFIAKMFEDALVSLGVVQDDSPKYVSQTILEVPIIDKKKRQKKITALGAPEISQDEDWLEIIIKSFIP